MGVHADSTPPLCQASPTAGPAQVSLLKSWWERIIVTPVYRPEHEGLHEGTRGVTQGWRKVWNPRLSDQRRVH